MKHPVLISLFFAFACGSASPSPTTSANTASACPAATDSCMNEDNHAECLAVEAQCAGTLLHLESCPLQFACE